MFFKSSILLVGIGILIVFYVFHLTGWNTYCFFFISGSLFTLLLFFIIVIIIILDIFFFFLKASFNPIQILGQFLNYLNSAVWYLNSRGFIKEGQKDGVLKQNIPNFSYTLLLRRRNPYIAISISSILIFMKYFLRNNIKGRSQIWFS